MAKNAEEGKKLCKKKEERIKAEDRIEMDPKKGHKGQKKAKKKKRGKKIVEVKN